MGGENDNGAAVGERLGAPVFCLRFFREDASIFRFAQCQVCSANIAPPLPSGKSARITERNGVTLVPIYHGQSRTPVPTKDTLHFLKNVL